MREEIENSNNLRKRQVDMHRDFFVRAESAVENRFYFEAILLEYAAIEGRLEVILGILGFPCNKELNASRRKAVNISDRIECLSVFRNNNPAIFAKTKLPGNFFSKNGLLRKWITNRNIFVHGLLKNVDQYSSRNEESCKIAKRGLEYSKLLYNEAKRLNRLSRSHPEIFKEAKRSCQNNKCIAIENIVDKQEAPTHV